MKTILLFASGSGSNVRAILEYFKEKKNYQFPAIFCNNAKAGVIEIAKEYGIDIILINKDIFQEKIFIDTITFFKPDLLVLAGFLWKIPEIIIKNFERKIINIHPSLLPKYGGKGMYGHFVHEAVVNNKETETGITIHFVNENYDEGAILLQKKININTNENANNVAAQVLKLEHEWYSKVIEVVLNS